MDKNNFLNPKIPTLLVLLLLFFLISAAHAESIVARSEYTGNTPRGTTSYEVGYRFRTGSTSRLVRSLGFIDLDNDSPDVEPDGDGLISPVNITLWLELTGQAVAQVTVPSGTTGVLVDGFRYAAIAEGPVTLNANTNYVISFNADTVSDWWLDANKAITLNSYFVGSNSSNTWEVRWGSTTGAMPTSTGSWGLGRTYGCVNMITSIPSVFAAYNPDPSDNAIKVGIPNGGAADVNLSWNTGMDPCDANNPNPNITSHLLYLKAGDADFNGVTPVNIAAASPPDARVSHPAAGLDYSQLYYWRVDEVAGGSPGIIEGPVWSFTTTNNPLIDHLTIDPDTRHQVFEGFGEGGMDQFVPYWYDIYPTANLESFLDQIYTLDDKGLGFTICRVLMPVGDAPGHYHHTKLYGNRAPESFELEDGVFDWSGHEDILWRHQGAAQRGAIMWANWYSMPYWMTISGCTSGASDGRQNLISGQEARFAEHACDVLEHYRDYWGIDFDYVSLLNEPEATWWVEGGGQPGCYFSSSQAIEVTLQLRDHLISHGLDTKLLAYDAAYTSSWWYLDNLLSSVIGPDLDVITCHQYVTSSAGLAAWKDRAQAYNKGLWQSEWGDWSNGGHPNDRPHEQALNHAAKISQALNDLCATGWVLWEPDFIFDIDADGFGPREAYWATAQYSRHIRPGMQRIGSADSHPDCITTAWINDLNQTLTLVSFNSNSGFVQIDYDFSAYGVVDIKEIRRTSSSEDYQYIPFTQTSGNWFSLTVPGESTTTVTVKITGCDIFKQADFNNDCKVDFIDLSEQACQWLSDLPCEQLDSDLNGDCDIDLPDFSKLAGQWD
ncbi:MAG: hypothetical protein JW804_05730 [Sedimentisphaerales bacterium]|nr:hypothetical protein [Sedimentisphaerales bacterium]